MGKNHSVLQGPKGGPFEHTKTLFSAKLIFLFIFFLNNHKKCILYQFKTFFTKICKLTKKNYWPQGLKIIAFQQSFSQCWWKRPILEGSFIKKIYLNHELGSTCFFLSCFAYILVKLLVFWGKLCKMSKKWFFIFQLLVCDSTLPMNLKSVLVYIVQ